MRINVILMSCLLQKQFFQNAKTNKIKYVNQLMSDAFYVICPFKNFQIFHAFFIQQCTIGCNLFKLQTKGGNIVLIISKFVIIF